jgi:competence ComEA-like helix-hairpin-helix protein
MGIVTPQRAALVLALMALFVAAAAARARASTSSRADPAGDRSEASYCLEVRHPEAGTGMACAAGPAGIMAAAVVDLGLPASCLTVTVPPGTPACAAVHLDPRGGGCALGTVGRMPAGRRLLCGGGIDLNLDSARELESLPGIGEVRAGMIVRWRNANGPFERPEDLQSVRGIGEKTVARVRPWLAAP